MTIKIIAKNTGFSIATVSRVINGNTKVNSEIREKILNENKRLDYKPNIQAQNLVLKKNKLIGVILSNISNPYFSEILNKIENNLFLHQYELIFMNTGDDKYKEKKCIEKMIRRNPEGIIFAPSFENESYMKKLAESGIPTVIITKILEKFDSVGISHEIGGELVAKHLINLGHEKIAYVSDTRMNSKFDGFFKELKKNDVHFSKKEDFLDIGTNDNLSLKEKVEICLKNEIEKNGSFKFSAIYASNDLIAFECMNFLKEKGYEIPKEVAICGFDGTDFSRISNISTVSQPTNEIVNIACDILFRKIKAKNDMKTLKEEKIEIVPRLISRNSTLQIIRR